MAETLRQFSQIGDAAIACRRKRLQIKKPRLFVLSKRHQRISHPAQVLVAAGETRKPFVPHKRGIVLTEMAIDVAKRLLHLKAPSLLYLAQYLQRLVRASLPRISLRDNGFPRDGVALHRHIL